MASSGDIVHSMRDLNLGHSPDPSSAANKSAKVEEETAVVHPKAKQLPAKTNPTKAKKGPSPFQSPQNNPSPSQMEVPAVHKAYSPSQGRVVPIAVPTSPKKTRRHPRNRSPRFNSLPKTDLALLSDQPASSLTTLEHDAISSLQVSRDHAPESTFKYIVQAFDGLKGPETIAGVYTDLDTANACAKRFAGGWGVKESDIEDIQSSFGCKARATRRSWQGGMSEIRVGGAWVKVLPKHFDASIKRDKKVYLAMDESNGLFVIGVFAEKEEAWDGCKGYVDKLTYCSELDGRKQWFDDLGMSHLQGSIGGKGHHWSVVEYSLDGEVQ
ncbi:hypothetical protein BKA65DRAFT_538727 [Rhexocercosporidium sp. MPI-PUGE-AT-0058]|nr:hypothetical protein BKA65DRAFT_538727 [Rhexocercosporidium sp. MPI-PUGE-AT-0058]